MSDQLKYPCRHELNEDCYVCMQEELDRLRAEVDRLCVELKAATGILPGPKKQFDRLIIGAGEYVRRDEAVKTVERLNGELVQADAHFKKMEAERDDMLKLSQLETEANAKLRAQLASARKALAPFAKFAAWIALAHPGWNHDEFRFASTPNEMPRFKAWRDALAALSDD